MLQTNQSSRLPGHRLKLKILRCLILLTLQVVVQTIQENYRSKMQSILTDQQKNQLKAAREQGKGRSGMQSLNLTDAQKQQMKDLRQSQRQEMYKVLTAEQKQQLQKMGQNRQRKSKSEDSPTDQG